MRGSWHLLILAAAFVVTAASLMGAPRAGAVTLYVIDPLDPQPSTFFGEALATGDINGDGRADVVVGSSRDAVSGASEQGHAYVFSGVDGSLLYDLGAAAPDLVAYSRFGHAVATGDVNGDGRADVAVGAPGALSTQAGKVYVFSGATGALLYEVVASALDTGFGWSVALGDVSGDGKADLLAGAAREKFPNTNLRAGRAYVYAETTGTLLYTLNTQAPALAGSFGGSVALGDLDGDSRRDMIVGASGEGPNAFGNVYTFSGATGLNVHVLSVPNLNAGAQGLGGAVAAADIDGDGRADVVAGGETQAVYEFSGVTGMNIGSIPPPAGASAVSFGRGLAVADFDGDGRADIAVSDVGDTVGGTTSAGRVYTFSRTGVLLLTSEGPSSVRFFGSALGAGDVSGDGRAELLVDAMVVATNMGRVFSGAPSCTRDDADCDGYADAAESAIGKSPLVYCAIMRADVDGDGTVSILDLSAVGAKFGRPIPAAPLRYDQGLVFDGSINIIDLSKMAAVFGKPIALCT